MSLSGGGRRKVAVVTGSRAEYGLLRPVLQAIRADPRVELQVFAAGAHLLPPANTIEEVRAKTGPAFEVALSVD